MRRPSWELHPGALKKYQLDYGSLSKVNPRLIYTNITGYGQTGSYRQRAGRDVMVEAEMGLMHIAGQRDGPPAKVQVAVTDLTTALYAVNSITAALIARGSSDRGQHIDVALSDCKVGGLANMGSSVLVNGEKDSGKWGTVHLSYSCFRRLSPFTVGFQTSDGDIMLEGGNDRLFGVLCDQLGRPQGSSDERLRSNSDQVTNRDILETMFEDVTKSNTTEHWLKAAMSRL